MIQRKTIHLLRNGVPACGFTKQPPYLWGSGDTSTVDPRITTCESCKKALSEEIVKKGSTR
jgi:hypothetical protein